MTSVTEIHDLMLPAASKTVTTEEDDHLSPLIMDNHTVISTEHHKETFKSVTRLIDVVDRIHEIPEFHPSGHHHAPLLRECDHKDSMGSVDSDISLERTSSLENSPVHVRYNENCPSSDDNAKDSGCDITSTERKEDDEEDVTPSEIPDDELSAQIVTQVEFYFSNENILKDAFLLKHVRRNKEGFVSLKLISSFKRVRQLTKDWRVVGYAIKRKSGGIQVNDVGTKVRRLEPLPVFDETMPSRTVVATDLPTEKLTIESVSELFSKCGDIALIRILRPGGTIPADVRQFYNKHPELHERECALVEFTESEAARVAQNLEGIQTYEMVAPKKKTGKKATISKIIENYKYPSYHDMERSRGGDGPTGEFKYNHTIRRGSAGYFVKHEQPQYNCTYRKSSFSNGVTNENCEHYNRRLSNCSIGSGTDLIRKFSNCSDGYCSEMSRRSSCSQESASRRGSQCSDVPFRRTSNCSDFCPCSRRSSQCSADNFRRPSQCNDHVRRFSNGANGFEQRRTSIPGGESNRRVSFDHNEFAERKFSSGSFGSAGFEQHYRKMASGVEQTRKVSGPVDKFDSRKLSADSGYDRRSSFGSMASDNGSGPRPKNGVIIPTATPVAGSNTVKTDAFVRTPIGPDGSKGFMSRARKMGQVVGPA